MTTGTGGSGRLPTVTSHPASPRTFDLAGLSRQA
jgi:hypothetical protein